MTLPRSGVSSRVISGRHINFKPRSCIIQIWSVPSDCNNNVLLWGILNNLTKIVLSHWVTLEQLQSRIFCHYGNDLPSAIDALSFVGNFLYAVSTPYSHSPLSYFLRFTLFDVLQQLYLFLVRCKCGTTVTLQFVGTTIMYVLAWLEVNERRLELVRNGPAIL